MRLFQITATRWRRCAFNFEILPLFGLAACHSRLALNCVFSDYPFCIFALLCFKGDLGQMGPMGLPGKLIQTVVTVLQLSNFEFHLPGMTGAKGERGDSSMHPSTIQLSGPSAKVGVPFSLLFTSQPNPRSNWTPPPSRT